MSQNFFGGSFFGGQFVGQPNDLPVKTGGKGDNAKKRRAIIKPTGLIYREESKRQVNESFVVTPDLEKSESPVIAIKQVTDDGVSMYPKIRISEMSSLAVTNEIKLLIGKELRTDEEEALLLIFMEAI